jgi:hypothetical protein
MTDPIADYLTGKREKKYIKKIIEKKSKKEGRKGKE